MAEMQDLQQHYDMNVLIQKRDHQNKIKEH